jgi:hypothetical protein
MTGNELWELYNSYGEVYSQPLNEEYEEYEEIDEVTGGGYIPKGGTTYYKATEPNQPQERLSQSQKRYNTARNNSQGLKAGQAAAGIRSKYSTGSREQVPSRNAGGTARSQSGTSSGLSMSPEKRAGLAAKRAERQGDMKRANKIRSRIQGAGNPDSINSSYDYDLYDLVLEYLLDEGLCESVENAEIMMAHMSEQWIDSIVESSEDSNTAGELARLRAQMRTAMQKGDDSSIKSISQRLSEIQAGARYKIGAELKGKTKRTR